MLNLHATFTKGTVEFRLFQFDKPSNGKQNGLHAGQLKSYIQLCLALSQMAKEVRTTSPKPQQSENPKYAMRTKIQWRCVKMKNEIQLRKCPKCGKIFGDRGAVSRVDNVTIVCSDCGIREALKSIGVGETEQEKILDTIHRTVHTN